jgi:hypothetical protein
MEPRAKFVPIERLDRDFVSRKSEREKVRVSAVAEGTS